MSKLKPGLGRGLDALINPKVKDDINKEITVSSNDIKQDDGHSYDVLARISVNNIKPNPFQPRTEFDPKALDELKKSILQNGLIQPITIRRIGENKYELISGERRLRACKDIGFKEVPAYIIKVETKEAMLALSLIENIQREKLNAIEVAQAYKRLLDECSLSHEEIAEKVGKDRTTITNSIRLLKLPTEVKQSLAREEISAGHARALINLPNDEIKLQMLNLIKKKNLSVRKIETLVKKYLSDSTPQAAKQKRKDDLEAIANNEVENKLRNIFGTKVMCKQKKDGSGEINIQFYSNDELERLFELFHIIEKNDY